jgi:hypothetical protein
LTGGDDRTAHLLDTATGAELRRLGEHTGGIRSAAFSPDGKSIVTASADKTARIRPTDYHDTIRYLSALLIRALTPDERSRYGRADQGRTCAAPKNVLCRRRICSTCIPALEGGAVKKGTGFRSLPKQRKAREDLNHGLFSASISLEMVLRIRLELMTLRFSVPRVVVYWHLLSSIVIGSALY